MIDNLVEIYVVRIRYNKHPSMLFEIFGEHENRTSAADTIKERINHWEKMLSGKSDEVYNVRHQLSSINSLGSVLKTINSLKERLGNDVTITVKFDSKTGDYVLPEVHIISDDASKGEIALKAVKKVLRFLNTTSYIV